MVKAKNKKDKRIIPLRQPGKSVETNDDRPSKLLFDEVLRQTEVRPDPDQTQTIPEPRPDPDQNRNSKNTKTAPKIAKQPAPVRDYNKRANSIDRDALPLGYFPGASKKIYDAIYLRTRGAVVPTRTIQSTRRELMDWSGIQNIKTINAHLKRLRESGLLKVTNFVGEQSGSIYEVFLPEEVGLELDPDQTQTRPNPDQKMDSDQYQKMVWVGLGKDVENTATYSDAKTSLKTSNKNDDDRALAIFAKKLDEASRKFTGKGTSANEAEKWGKLAELLILELELAARNTKSISSVPAFLTEVLRRRLILNPEERKQTRSNKSNLKKPNWIDVGKNYDDVESSYNPETGEYEIKPLSESGKSKALELVLEAKTEGKEFLEDLRKWYLPDDWEWLMKELESKLLGKQS